MVEELNPYDAISPLDFRYYLPNKKLYDKLHPYLSEEAFVHYQLKVEVAITKALAKQRICSQQIAREVEQAAHQVTAKEVYAEDAKIHHYTRALANCLRNKVSAAAKPYVHFTATSFDIFDTANALRYRDVVQKVVIPDLGELEKTLIDIARREKNTLQIGRTHGQHAVPITFGFALSEYVARFGNSILKLREASKNLRGKMAGAVGAYNAQSLFFSDPLAFEKEVLAELDLKPGSCATQIVEPEYVMELMHGIIAAFGVLANLADDMRHLQRSEIAEVAEKFDSKQVGSSTMPHKRNPWNFENIKSMYKTFMPRMMTCYLDQISEHQRDLSNSASSRFYPEMIAGFVESVNRMHGLMNRLVVDITAMERNLSMHKQMVIAEPLYLLLAAHDHPDAHEVVRELTLKAQKTGKSLMVLVRADPSLQPYVKKFTKEQKLLLEHPERYVGMAPKKTELVCNEWEQKLFLAQKSL
ncbi:adenylosuccinate lyase [Candidatus Woesearchaeota archaeon]|nr:adenylosuccinate lyase [Candidatus Woesearchaeota archaeon]